MHLCPRSTLLTPLAIEPFDRGSGIMYHVTTYTFTARVCSPYTEGGAREAAYVTA